MKKTLLFLLISNFVFSQWSISNAERSALLNIYNYTNGENWNRTWDTTQDPRLWFGVVVKNGVVTELNLSNNALKGNFPTNISSLSNLQKLDLSSNQLSGDISSGLGSLSSLTKLDISKNRLTGNPATAFAGLFNVQELSFGDNFFTIPDVNALLQNFNNITLLDISNLELTAVPQKVAAFTNLATLNLDNNKIAANGFQSISSLTNLKNLSLSGNQLSSLPGVISQIKSIITLDLSNNSINENGLTSVANLINLEWLSLENNLLTQVPAQISQLTNLQMLNLGRNEISGGFSGIASLPKLQQLFLNNNKISGNFPSEFLSMQHLLMLNLNSNQITGNLPDKLPPITQLSNNRMTKNSLFNYVSDFSEQTEFDYSPQRYDEAKTVLAVIDNPATLDQSLANEFSFSWFKNLDEKMSNTAEKLYFSAVKQSDYAVYTAEAYTYEEMGNNNVFQLSLFREPITLADALGTFNTNEISTITIYPNPTTEFVNIINSKVNIEKVLIYDLSGKQMLSSNLSRVNVSKLPSGVYLLSVKTEKGIRNFKLIKE